MFLLFLELGLSHNDILKIDLWQYYGYLKIIKEKIRRELIKETYEKRNSQLLFLLCKANGLKSEYEDFFDFEEKINKVFEEDKNEIKDKLERKGQYENGEWIYNYDEICDIMKYIDDTNK